MLLYLEHHTSVVNEDLTFNAKAKDLTHKAKDLTFKAKAKDLTHKAKAKDLTLKAKAKDLTHKDKDLTLKAKAKDNNTAPYKASRNCSPTNDTESGEEVGSWNTFTTWSCSSWFFCGRLNAFFLPCVYKADVVMVSQPVMACRKSNVLDASGKYC